MTTANNISNRFIRSNRLASTTVKRYRVHTFRRYFLITDKSAVYAYILRYHERIEPLVVVKIFYLCFTHLGRLISASGYENLKLGAGISFPCTSHLTDIGQSVFKRRERRVERTAEIIEHILTGGKFNVGGLRNEDALKRIVRQYVSGISERARVNALDISKIFIIAHTALHVMPGDIERCDELVKIIAVHTVLYQRRKFLEHIKFVKIHFILTLHRRVFKV